MIRGNKEILILDYPCFVLNFFFSVDVKSAYILNAPLSFIVIALALGAAYGTSKAGIGIAGIGSFKPELVMKVD